MPSPTAGRRIQNAAILVLIAIVAWCVMSIAAMKKEIRTVNRRFDILQTATATYLYLCERIATSMETRQQLIEKVILENKSLNLTIHQLANYNKDAILKRNNRKKYIGGSQ